MDNKSPEQFYKIKKIMMERLNHNFILPQDDPAFEYNEMGKAFMLQARRKIAGAQNNEQIVQALTQLKTDFEGSEGPKNFYITREEDNPFRQRMETFYRECGLYSPEKAIGIIYKYQSEIDKIDEDFKNQENTTVSGGFKGFIKDKLEKLSIITKEIKKEEKEQVKPLSEWSEDEFYKHHAPLCTDYNYTDEILIPASQVASKYNLAGVDKKNGDYAYGKMSNKHEDMKQFISSLDQHLDEASRALGITHECLGLQGTLCYALIESNLSVNGVFNSEDNTVSIIHQNNGFQKASFADTLTHEWTHALDSKIGKDYKKHLEAQGRDTKEFAYFGSIYLGGVVLDDSPQAKSYKALQDFLVNIVAKEPEAFKETQRKGQEELTKSFFYETLGADYFTLSQEKLSALHSDETFQFIKSKLIKPLDKAGNEQLLNKLIEIIPEHVNEHVINYVNTVDSTPLLKSSKYEINKLDDIKRLGISSYIQNSRFSDSVGNNERKTQKAKIWDSSEVEKSTYYESTIEAFARYMESQTFNKLIKAKDKKGQKMGIHCYFNGLRTNFEKNRKELFTTCFGAKNVFERTQEFNIQTEAEKRIEKQEQKNERFLKASSAFIRSINKDSILHNAIWAKVHDIQVSIRENKEFIGEMIDIIKGKDSPDKEQKKAPTTMANAIISMAESSGINLKNATAKTLAHQESPNDVIVISIDSKSIKDKKHIQPEPSKMRMK